MQVSGPSGSIPAQTSQLNKGTDELIQKFAAEAKKVQPQTIMDKFLEATCAFDPTAAAPYNGTFQTILNGMGYEALSNSSQCGLQAHDFQNINTFLNTLLNKWTEGSFTSTDVFRELSNMFYHMTVGPVSGSQNTEPPEYASLPAHPNVALSTHQQGYVKEAFLGIISSIISESASHFGVKVAQLTHDINYQGILPKATLEQIIGCVSSFSGKLQDNFPNGIKKVDDLSQVFWDAFGSILVNQ